MKEIPNRILTPQESRELINSGRMTSFKKGKAKRDKDAWNKEIFKLEALEASEKREFAKQGEYFFITYNGFLLSMNDLVNNEPIKLSGMTKKLKKNFEKILKESNLPTFSEIELSIFFNGRFDVDNLAATEKYFLDSLVKLKFLKNDIKRFFPKISIEWDKGLPSGTVIFKIKELKGN